MGSEVSHLVQEHSAAIRVFGPTGTRLGGTREGAAHVSEELAFEERVDHRRAVAHREPLLRDRTHLVNRFGD